MSVLTRARLIAGGAILGLILALAVAELYAQSVTRNIGQLVASNYLFNDGTAGLKVAVVDDDGALSPIDFDDTDMVAALNTLITNTDGLNDLPTACDKSAQISISTIANNEIIPISAGAVIKVCNIMLVSRGTVEVQAIYGTGTACATGEQNLSGPISLKVDGTQPPGFSAGNADGTFFISTVGQAFCLELSAGVQVDGWISYAQYVES